VLVLPPTFFLDGFTRYKEEDVVTHLDNMAKVTFIAEFIMRKRAFYPNVWSGATSETAFNIFEKKLNTTSAFSKLNLDSLKEALFIDEDQGINNLKTYQQTIIAVADKLLKTYEVNPIIVVRKDAVEKWETVYIAEFYKGHKSRKQTLAVFSLDQTLECIKNKYKELYYSSRENINDVILKNYLPK
jgi:hypothetical protein